MEDGGKLPEHFVFEEGQFVFGFHCFFTVDGDFFVVWLNTHWFVEREKDIAEGLEAIDPFYDTAFFVERSDGICSNVKLAST